jgi:hypothetical protein
MTFVEAENLIAAPAMPFPVAESLIAAHAVRLPGALVVTASSAWLQCAGYADAGWPNRTSSGRSLSWGVWMAT